MCVRLVSFVALVLCGPVCLFVVTSLCGVGVRAARHMSAEDQLVQTPLMSAATHDPFHVVKDELVGKMESIDLKVTRFNGLLYGPGTTSGNAAFRDAKKALAREIRGAEGQLKDLGLTVEYVERDRAAFAHIDDRELDERRASGPHKGASIVLQLEFLAIECVRKSIHPTRT